LAEHAASALHESAGLFFLDRNSAVADADLDAGLVALLIQLIAEHRRDDSQRTDDQKSDVSIHALAVHSDLVAKRYKKTRPVFASRVTPDTYAMGGIEGIRMIQIWQALQLVSEQY